MEGNTVSIRRQGQSLILEPTKPSQWSQGFFDRIRIDDPAFARPPQGELPPAPPSHPIWSLIREFRSEGDF